MQYRFLTAIAMVFITIKLMSIVLIYKIISIAGFEMSASTLIIPFWLMMCAIIAEVYGYQTAKQLIFIVVFCQFIFSFICAGFSSIEILPDGIDQAAMQNVLSKLPRVAIGSNLAILAGAFVNVALLSRWKEKLSGRYFWLRCLAASAIAECVFTIIAYLIEFLGMTSFTHLFHWMLISYLAKCILNPILVIPSALLAYYLKEYETLRL